MSHPHQEHRQHKVERNRVHAMLKSYASGGSVMAEDVKLVKKIVKPNAMKMDGGKPKHRGDRVARARGGRTKKGTNVTVVVAPQGGGNHPTPPSPMGAALPPALPSPRPAMPLPGGPPTAPGGGGMPMPIRRTGGRAYASGGAVKDGPAWKEGLKAGTQVSHTPGKNDLADIGRGKPITYKRGGAVEAPQGVAPATKLPGGAGGGEARLAKEHRAERR